ncbi:SpoIIE family protein phosphatase [Streptomyces uncialis]|uniref:ATP-binding SpoIIE family protein phosphatase n=1 Tax=Streptomyces uncialis TaxID=1048205 RepID=UPI003655FD52
MEAFDINSIDLACPLDIGRAAVAVLDGRGTVTGWNDKAEELLGYRAVDVVGRPAARLLAGTGAPLPVIPATHEPMAGAAVLRHVDGHQMAVWMDACQVEQMGDECWLVVGVERAALRQWQLKQAILKGVFAQSPIGLAVYDTDQNLTWMNAAGDEVLAGLIGARADTMLPDVEYLERPDGKDTAQALEQLLNTGEPRSTLTRARPPRDAKSHHVWSSTAFRLSDESGVVLGLCEEFTDVTARYNDQQRLMLLGEAGARIAGSLDVTGIAAGLADVCVPRFAEAVVVDVLTPLLRGEEVPVGTAAPALTRVARTAAREEFQKAGPPPYPVHYPAESAPSRSLLTGQTVLSRIETGAVGIGHPVSEADDPLTEELLVPLRTPRATIGVVTFLRSARFDAFSDEDVDLAGELAARTAVSLDNAWRYAREHATALTLQQSLLPEAFAPHTAVDIAHRYLPARSSAGVGGDWFDLIPLSGARVALAVGDVVGHGLQAAATMGRLRTTVQALAHLDLAPEELLSRLDDLVGRTPSGQGRTAAAETTMASCLYAVYDPVTRLCSIARAGHLPPAIVLPDGTARFADAPAGPPLGVGGLPFETAEIELPEGSVLALFTDGLVETRTRDLDTGLQRLQDLLTHPDPSLEKTCDHLVQALLPKNPEDDAALLLARMHSLPKDTVATWQFAPDPGVVANARALTADQLAAWGLEDAVFTTELIVSELVTNAIRYAPGPIRLRLIRDRSLICEVSDSGFTSPHLRQASDDEEGGRGLFLVAQLTERWGARYHPAGKTIWAEQRLPHG